MNFSAAKHYILQRLIHELPSKLYYHGLHHTFDVYDASKQLAAAENVTGEDLILLKTAVLFHDAGFIEQYSHNEPIAVRMTKEALPQFGYTESQIDIISEIIMATAMQDPPQTLLEKIIRDADLDYLGRVDFFVLAGLLKKELAAHGVEYSEQQWNEMQVKFLKNHVYFTEAAIQKNRAEKELRIQEILSKGL